MQGRWKRKGEAAGSAYTKRRGRSANSAGSAGFPPRDRSKTAWVWLPDSPETRLLHFQAVLAPAPGPEKPTAVRPQIRLESAPGTLHGVPICCKRRASRAPLHAQLPPPAAACSPAVYRHLSPSVNGMHCMAAQLKHGADPPAACRAPKHTACGGCEQWHRIVHHRQQHAARPGQRSSATCDAGL